MSYSIDVSEQAGVRYLHFGSPWIQGAMRIARPHQLELAYTREMMLGLLLRGWSRWPRRALLIGLGAASLLRFLHHHLPHCVLDVVEIDARVVACARQFFRLPPEDERFTLHLADGAEFIAREGVAYDFIAVDGFDQKARAGALDSPDFYRAARARLSLEGVLAVNLLGSEAAKKRSTRWLGEVFGQRLFTFASADEGNVIALGAAGNAIVCPLPELHERARALKQETGLDLAPSLARLLYGHSFPGEQFTC